MPNLVPVARRPHLDHVDATRPVKQFGVISTHTLIAFAPAASLGAGGLLMVLHVSREAFFFVSACMLTYANPVIGRGDLWRFYRRRAAVIVLPYLAWTLVYWLVDEPHPHPFGAAMGSLLHLVLVGYYQLYYLLVIAQFYLLYPLVIRLVRACRRPGLLLGVSAALQLALTGVMHWGLMPSWLSGYWATREITSYQLYLLAGCVVARDLPAFERWLVAHTRAVIVAVVATAAVAEAWYLAAAEGAGWLGVASDVFQPIVVPWYAASILGLYLLGRWLVRSTHSVRFRRLVRLGADNAYGIFLAQMLFITGLSALGWGNIPGVPWFVQAIGASVLTFCAGGVLSWVLSHTAVSQWLTGQRPRPWGTPVVPVQEAEFGAAGDGRPLVPAL